MADMVDVPASGWRARVRSTRVGAVLLKVVVFVLGAVFIVVGGVLIVLPGPLTIPPVLLGVWIWSTEFAWAERLRLQVAQRARVAWDAARRRPVHSVAATVGGLLLLAAGLVAAQRYDIVDRVMGSFG
jgi:uncharacterized membrane protein